jgi:hypothetical protein
MNKRIIFVLLALSLTTIFCTTQPVGTAAPTANVNAIVNATLTALAVPAAVSTNTPAIIDTPTTARMSSFPTGTITGYLSYPAEALPAQRVVAWNIADNSHYAVDTLTGQSVYELVVPTGNYTVVAYVIGGGSGLAGGYSKMVPCGLKAGCDDHALIPVEVTSGAILTDINPQDWYAGTGAFPPMPTSP